MGAMGVTGTTSGRPRIESRLRTYARISEDNAAPIPTLLRFGGRKGLIRTDPPHRNLRDGEPGTDLKQPKRVKPKTV